jgi:hypothetical protein
MPSVDKRKQPELPTAGRHLARLVEWKDLGLVTDFRGHETQRIRLDWVLLAELDAQAEPIRVHESCFLSLETDFYLFQAVTATVLAEPGNEPAFGFDSLFGTEC